jgi:hypothetical protein
MTFKVTSRDKILVRGDSLTLRFRAREKQLNPNDKIVYLDLTGSDITSTVKLTPTTDLDFRDVPPAVVKTSDDTLEILKGDQLDPDEKGMFRVFLKPPDTRFLPPGVYDYDAQITTAQGDVYTLKGGRILLRSRPTEAEDLTPP